MYPLVYNLLITRIIHYRKHCQNLLVQVECTSKMEERVCVSVTVQVLVMRSKFPDVGAILPPCNENYIR